MRRILDEIAHDVKFIKGHTLQPRWYKIFKIFMLLGLIVGYVLIYGGLKALIFFSCFFAFGLIMHIMYRINTRKFTQSWLDFKVTEKDGQLEYQRIGIYYYIMVAVNATTAFVLSQLVVG